MTGPATSLLQFFERRPFLAVVVIVTATFLAYFNSIEGRFILDDMEYLTDCHNLKTIGTLREVLSTRLRPVVDLTFAASSSLSEDYLEPKRDSSHEYTAEEEKAFVEEYERARSFAFHCVNIPVHILAAVALFYLARKTFQFFPNRFAAPTNTGMALAILWALHPLTTQAVTYVSQRAQSMEGMFLLLQLLTFSYGATATQRSRVWYGFSLVFCLLGTGCKQDMVVAPFAALLYDHCFLSGRFGPLRKRWYVHLGYFLCLLALFRSFGMIVPTETTPTMAAPPVVLPVCTYSNPELAAKSFGLSTVPVTTTKTPELTVGFALRTATPYQYLLTQSEVILHYIRQAVWPTRLCFDYYDWPVAKGIHEVAPALFVIISLLAFLIPQIIRGTPTGFLGGWFFLMLAPSSSLIPILDVAFEHRMYMALISIVTLVLLGVSAVVHKLRESGDVDAVTAETTLSGVVTVVAVILAVATILRNDTYSSPLAMWKDASAIRPNNWRAAHNVANELYVEKRLGESIAAYEQSLKIRGGACSVDHMMSATILIELRRYDEAERHFAEVERHLDAPRPPIDPGIADRAGFYYQWGTHLIHLGRHREAVHRFQQALLHRKVDTQITPDIYSNIAYCLVQLGRREEAHLWYERESCEYPNRPAAHFRLGLLHLERNDLDGAERYFLKVLEQLPKDPDATDQLGIILERKGKLEEAIAHYRAATVGNAPEKLQLSLAHLLHKQGKLEEARSLYRELQRKSPELAREWANAAIHSLQGADFTPMLPDALRRAEIAVELSEERDPFVLHNYAILLADASRFDEARRVMSLSLRLLEAELKGRPSPYLDSFRNHKNLIDQGKKVPHTPPKG